MVRYAVNKDGILLDAEHREYSNKHDSYTCLFCGLPLSFRKGSIKTYRKTSTTFECVSCFTHGNSKDENIGCISDNFVSSKNESETHRKAKNTVTNILEETTKLYFPQDNFQPIQEFVYPGRRADVAMVDKNGVGFANFEEQVSPVPFDYLNNRYIKDKNNKVGNTYFAIGEINRTAKTDNKGVGGIAFDKGSLAYSCLNNFGIVHDIQKVATKQKIVRYRDTRTNFEYDSDPITIDSYIRFYEERKISENQFIRPTPFTTDQAAILIYESVIEHEKLLKNTQYIDLQSPANFACDDIELLDQDDEDDHRYATCLLKVESEKLAGVRLICKTDQGYIGTILEFNIESKKAKIVLLGENINSAEWIDFKYLYVSDKDVHLCFTSSKSNHVNSGSKNSEYPSYIEVISETIIEFPRTFNNVNDFNEEVFRKINQIDEPSIIQERGLLNLDLLVLNNVNEKILDINGQENKSNHPTLEVSVDIQSILQSSNEVIDIPQLIITNEIIDSWQKCGLPDIYDYSLVNEGDRVKSAIELNRYGIVASKTIQTDSGTLKHTTITIIWDDGGVSNPYPHQLIRFIGD